MDNIKSIDLTNIGDISIPNYHVLELLGKSRQSLVFKAISKQQPERYYTLKLFRHPLKHENLRRYLKQKVERLKIIHDVNIITPIAFEYYGDVQFIVQDFFSSLTLRQWRRQNTPSLMNFFNLAGQLALALNAVQEAGIIHGGVKPNNILIRPDTLALRLTDFITPIDIREISHFIYDPGFVGDTLAYTSPEQTGRINHRVDFSTDIYSMGIIFYQLLSGRLPFKSTDPLELIHAHLAEEAPRVQQINPEVPVMLGEIVAKMTLKEPEKRYQSGSGLYADLQLCATEYRTIGRVLLFKTGRSDYNRRVIFISKMVGRQAEARTVLDLYDQVVHGGFAAVFISGLPGIGKTRLIQELQRPLVEHHGYFTSGKFDQYQKNIPYSSLLQALRNLIRTFLTESDERVALWRRKILETVEQQGRVITDVVPELSILIGSQPEVSGLPPVEARNRFNNLFGRFLACLCSPENPLVLFIDDLQWCDSATFEFLEHIFANTEDYPYLYFVGAYRNNEVDSGHPLSHLMRSIQARHQPLHDLRLGALDAHDCHEMVAYILDLPLEQTENLALFLTQLTEGNPLFVSESLSWLHNEQLLLFGENGQWDWDLEKIRHSSMPLSVVELFSSKVRKLPDQTLDILMLCACMGNRFTAEDIAVILEIDYQSLFECLKPVLSLGLVMESKTELQFVHDRVQEAVLRLIDAEKRRDIHWRIGLHLLNGAVIGPALEQQENLFTVAAHLNLGRPSQMDAPQALEMATINFHVGNKALDALATQAANEYYRNSLALLSEDAWSHHYTLTFRLHQRLAKTELMGGRYEVSEKLLDTLLSNAADNLDRAEALAEQTTSLSSIGNFIKAIEVANRGLAYFDKAIPDNEESAGQRMQTLMKEIHKNGDVWHIILNMPFTQDRRSKIELAFYSELIPDLYMSGLVPQLYLSSAQSTLLCLQGGMAESVIYSFSIMGLNLGEQNQFELAFRYQDLAHELCARYPDTFGATRGINGIVWCNMHSRSHPSEIVTYCYKGIQFGKNSGDLYNAGLCYGPLMWNLQVQGASFGDIADVAAECLEFSSRNQLSFSVGLAEAVMSGWVEPMKSVDSPRVSMTDKLALWQSRNHVASAGSYFVHLSLCSFYFGRYQEAAGYLDEVKHYLTGMTDNVLKRQWYVFQALNALRLYRQQPGDSLQTLADNLKFWIEPVETWATLGPLLKPYLALYHAERACCFADFDTAVARYLDAIEAARLQSYTFLEGFANESLGEWLAAAGRQSIDMYWREAMRLYQRCGAQGKQLRMREQHPSAFDDPEDMGLPASLDFQQESTLPNLNMDYLVKSALALSAEIDQEKLLTKVMRVVMQSSGAQHGYLMIQENNVWIVRAVGHMMEQLNLETRRHPLGDSENLCQGIVHYVSRTRKMVVLTDAQQSPEFRNLPEIIALGVRSLLCLPLLRQGELVGLLYLENRLAPGVFTADKVRDTELLSLQAAISMENARLIAEIARFNTELEQRVSIEVAKNREKDHLLIKQSRLAVMGEMINNIAHQWRQPLNALGLVLGNIKDAQRFGELTPDYLHRQEQEARQYIDKMSDTINDFRDFFKPDKTNEWFSVNHAIDEAISLVDASFKVQGIRIMLDVQKDIEQHGFPNEYSQVLLNLLTNAKDAISARGISDGLIMIRLTQEDGLVRLAITDNGGGIDEEIMPRLFEPYFSTKEGGTGIGLYMSKMIIENSMGGHIEVRNHQDGGEFSIVTPINGNNEVMSQ
ncbi:MAG: AAA family ATPase [Methylococcales bacterium]|nr:AAA family ATPase [Methylococcales bacterium]